CITFSGDNGGATYRGVTPTEINVTLRMASVPDFSAAPGDSGPSSVFKFDRAEVERTMRGLVEYFNSRFQFYGRKLKLHIFDGEGDFVTELQGGGQEEVEADATKAVEEYNAFADVAAISAPYADALARRQVINIGAPYMSAEWLAGRAPYSWSQFTDCSFVSSTVSDWMNKRVAGRPAAKAGGELQGQPRRIALIAPENPWYQQCADAGQRVLEEAGNEVAARLAYKLDLNTLSNQAASIVAKLRDQNITTIVCGCDPAFPIFLTSKAQEQSYEPEWVIVGAGFVDFDVFGQLYQQDQWSRSFGVSFLGTLQPLRGGYGYAAFKSVRPNEEPSSLVDIFYYQLYLLAIGVQGAGPNLTPESYARGMYAYPGGTGLVGTWKFQPGRYTPTVDAREIYWDPEKVSVQNNEPGAYVETEPGRRYRPGEWPEGEPTFGAQ
ncbi:MAG: ABC transporter substrate-binding protein, partial [Acidimicrobiia bacterium]